MELTKNNFELYAAKHYQKDKWATTEDFKEPLLDIFDEEEYVELTRIKVKRKIK